MSTFVAAGFAGLSSTISLRDLLVELVEVDLHKTETRTEDESEVRANTSFESQYRDGTRYHFGVEWQVPVVALDLRAGYYTDPLPFLGPRDANREVDSETNPLVIAKRDRAFLTFGAGLEMEEAVGVNLAWNRGKIDVSTFGDGCVDLQRPMIDVSTFEDR